MNLGKLVSNHPCMLTRRVAHRFTYLRRPHAHGHMTPHTAIRSKSAVRPRRRRSGALPARQRPRYLPQRSCTSSQHRRRRTRRRSCAASTCSAGTAAGRRALEAPREPAELSGRRARLLPLGAAPRRRAQRHQPCPGTQQAGPGAGCCRRRPTAAPRPCASATCGTRDGRGGLVRRKGWRAREWRRASAAAAPVAPWPSAARTVEHLRSGARVGATGGLGQAGLRGNDRGGASGVSAGAHLTQACRQRRQMVRRCNAASASARRPPSRR